MTTIEAPAQEAVKPATSADAKSAKPAKNGNGQNSQRPAGRSVQPLGPSELKEITEKLERIPGLGRAVLNIVRNRDARVVVPETPIGNEFIQVITELDRLLGRAANSLTRNLSPENMAAKASIESDAVKMLGPLVTLTATLAMDYDTNPNSRILRQPSTRAKLRTLQEAANKSKAPADTPVASVTKKGSGKAAGAAAGNEAAPE